jgi:hypothetical protein
MIFLTVAAASFVDYQSRLEDLPSVMQADCGQGVPGMSAYPVDRLVILSEKD